VLVTLVDTEQGCFRNSLKPLMQKVV